MRKPLRSAALLLGGVLALTASAGAAWAQSTGDARANEIAAQALDAVRRNWALARYDAARQVRAAINLRGAGTQGVTGNLVLDRDGPRWRLDVAGGVGPLTLWAMPDMIALHVPALEQHATRAGGDLARVAAGVARLDAEVAAMQSRLAGGYTELTLGGDETIDGAATWRLDDRPEPGTTASYWIDQRSHLPRRIAVDRPGRRDARIELSYGGGARPVRAVAYLQGQRDAQVTLTPTYDSVGRVASVQAVIVPAGGSTITTDLTFDWSPGMGASFFRFAPPAESREVPFGQLSQGVLIMAAGALGALLPVLLGAS
ncbi:MAG TPA: hypothetical protein VFH11_06330 [Gemmatimonadota bacterium]|nr:hypothetical protein [Gemmatimonadota bacterium]